MVEAISFADKLKSDRADLVYLVKADEPRGRAWFYIEVLKAKRELFLDAVKQDNFDLTQYGKILDSGWGDNPPAEAIKNLEEQYNSEAAAN